VHNLDDRRRFLRGIRPIALSTPLARYEVVRATPPSSDCGTADIRRAWIALPILLIVAGTASVSSQQSPSTPAPAAPSPVAGGAGEETEGKQQPVFRTGVNLVRVDTLVTDKLGIPILDLKQTDFEVFEDGKPQTVEDVRLIRATGAAPAETTRGIRSRADEAQAAADENARMFVFFLDDYHVRLNNSLTVRKALVEFIESQIGPGDLLAVMYPLTPIDAVTLTRDHQSVIRALTRFEGRKFNYQPRHAVEAQYAHYPAESIERVRRQVSLTALESLAVKLGVLREERKAVIVVSEGYSAQLPPALRDPVGGFKGAGEAPRTSFSREGTDDSDYRADMEAAGDIQSDMEGLLRAASRSNTAMYPVDPRGLALGEFDGEEVTQTQSLASLRQTMDTLRVLAEETDGRAIVNRSDLAGAMKQIVADSSAYYLLAYSSTKVASDGKFHKIKVRVKRSGANVRSRKGYWAPTAAETSLMKASTRPAPPPAVSKARSTIVEPSRARYVRSWVGTTLGDDGKARITFVWEPVAPPAGVRRDVADSVALIAASPDGATYFRGNVGERATAATASNAVTFDVPPGRLQLRVSVSAAGDIIDAEDRELLVPDPTAAPLVLATPRVYIARTARDSRIICNDANVTPTASRDFRRSDRLVVRADVYTRGEARTTLTSTLLNKFGDSLAALPVSTSCDRPVIDLPLAAVAPGEYLIRIAAASEGREPVTELIAFRVGS
jgi:VWFA-related protein